jgi:Zn-dependent protease with chaperone function
MSEPQFSLCSCQHCGQNIEFPSEGAGMLVGCPHCGSETILTAAPSPVQASADEITAAELKEALACVIPRRRISVLYQAGMVLVLFFMALLPLAYLAFALLVAYATYWYGVHARRLFSGFTGGLYVLILKLILYIGPLVAGGIAVFFMFKPIFARRRKRAEPVELNPAQHPRLYQFIAHVSDMLRVSMPRRIYLDCDVNASAGFHRGFISLLGNDLVLNVGLQLLAGLNTRQFAAVIAHELSHCTQAFAMRVSYIIESINRWFARVVYERDTWDEGFDEWANSVKDWRLSMIVACAAIAIWASRKVLWLLMCIGQAASCFLSRQMEFHADSCAVAVAGSSGVESLLIRFREQAVLSGLAYNGLSQFWKQKHQLPDSLPDLLDQLEKRLPAKFHKQAQLTLLNETAGWFATHPTAAQRIQKARQQDDPGIFVMEKPARSLLKDFASTSRMITARHYRQNLRLAATDHMLKPVGEFFQGK